jgi:predicted ArsR family transcriptional regulator
MGTFDRATYEQRHNEMHDDALDNEVLSFIFDNIDTVPHLEAILLIWQSGSNAWSSDLLASRIYVSPQQAKGILEDLRRRGFLVQEPAESGRYIFSAEADSRELIQRVADTYRRNLVVVTRIIHSKGSASVREFARAFQIKKDQ